MARTRSAPAGFAATDLLRQAGGRAEKLARQTFTAPTLRRLILILITIFLLLTIVGTAAHVIYGKRVALAEARQNRRCDRFGAASPWQRRYRQMAE